MSSVLVDSLLAEISRPLAAALEEILAVFQRTIREYEHKVSVLQEEKQRRFQAELRLSVCEEEPPPIKKEEEEFPVKRENEEEWPQWSQLHHPEESREAGPPASTSAGWRTPVAPEGPEGPGASEGPEGPGAPEQDPRTWGDMPSHCAPIKAEGGAAGWVEAGGAASGCLRLGGQGQGQGQEPSSSASSSQQLPQVEKPFQCAVCGVRLGHALTLRSHLRRHGREPPFSCSDCGRRFSQAGNLKRHRRLHTGEKPFSCSTCGRGFSDHTNLTRHRVVHTGERPFCCSACGKSFTRSSLVRSHKCLARRS